MRKNLVVQSEFMNNCISPIVTLKKHLHYNTSIRPPNQFSPNNLSFRLKEIEFYREYILSIVTQHRRARTLSPSAGIKLGLCFKLLGV